ncbi:hypothetical protein E1B28_006468 [Marasmius oreades]|uniref:Uncharacterized protein n=1 Tax=Marasmius oreades TaxID=181124 RepID=A0A9P7UVL4_9AGAR|nr:uncharacterized protein E1B28_006468 [Marasmius oreades]KAG7095763.1 hypothetical protein E1B28_006468 [Marasmius oreades]
MASHRPFDGSDLVSRRHHHAHLPGFRFRTSFPPSSILDYVRPPCFSLFDTDFLCSARNKIVLLLVLLGVIIHVVFGFISGIYVLVIRQPVYHFGVSSATIAAVTCAATDLFIAINMFHTARRINTIDTSVQNLLYRLSIIGMTNGIVTATTTTLMIILLFTSIEAFTLVFDLVGRVYTLTIVVNCVALKRQKPPRDESVTQTTRNSRRSGSVVLTTLELNTFTIPEDIETESSEPPSHAKSVPVARMRDTETPDSVIGVY